MGNKGYAKFGGGQINCIMEDGKWRMQQMCPKKIDNNYPVLKRVLSVTF